METTPWFAVVQAGSDEILLTLSTKQVMVYMDRNRATEMAEEASGMRGDVVMIKKCVITFVE